MKKLLKVSLVAMFVATPMIASAVPYSDGSTTTKPTITANTEVATTSYVKGAYDELAEAINTATSTANNAANQDLSNISSAGQTVIDNRAVAKINDAAGTATATSLTASNGVLTVAVDGTTIERNSTSGALQVKSTAFDAAGAAATAEQNAKDYADGLASNYDAAGAAAAAQTAAQSYADGLASNYDAAGAAAAAETAAKTYAAGMTLPVYGTWRTATSTGNATLTAPASGS